MALRERLGSMLATDQDIWTDIPAEPAITTYHNTVSRRSYDLMQSPTEDLELYLGSVFEDVLAAGWLHIRFLILCKSCWIV